MQDTGLPRQPAASTLLSWCFGRVQTWVTLPVPRDTHCKSEAASSGRRDGLRGLIDSLPFSPGSGDWGSETTAAVGLAPRRERPPWLADVSSCCVFTWLLCVLEERTRDLWCLFFLLQGHRPQQTKTLLLRPWGFPGGARVRLPMQET